jgi:hypothetical protein
MKRSLEEINEQLEFTGLSFGGNAGEKPGLVLEGCAAELVPEVAEVLACMSVDFQVTFESEDNATIILL